MEKSQADALAVLLTNSHAENFKLINSQPELRRYGIFKAATVKIAKGDLSFYDGHPATLKIVIKSFMLNPSQQKETPYMIVDIDDRCGWIKLMRFVGNKHAELNTETVCILLSEDRTVTNSFGFRYEHPERFEGNKHGFFHIQPIVRDSTAVDLPGRSAWLPDNFPTFYMFATCAFELALYTIHSLAGWEPLSELQVRSRDSNGVLKHLVRVGDSSRLPYPFNS